MRWQVEAAEKKQREEDEINRVIAEKAKERLIAVIINPDDYYGCDLPNVPYGKPCDAFKLLSIVSFAHPSLGISDLFLQLHSPLV